MSTVVTAGPALAMLAGTMTPEAFQRMHAHPCPGLVAPVGDGRSIGLEGVG